MYHNTNYAILLYCLEQKLICLEMFYHSFIAKMIIAAYTVLISRHSLHTKLSFPLRSSSVNVTKSAVSCEFGHIYWKKTSMENFIDGFKLCHSYKATTRRQFTLSYSVPRSSWHSFNRPRKDESLSWPWGHRAVLNSGPLDRELICGFFCKVLPR